MDFFKKRYVFRTFREFLKVFKFTDNDSFAISKSHGLREQKWQTLNPD